MEELPELSLRSINYHKNKYFRNPSRNNSLNSIEYNSNSKFLPSIYTVNQSFGEKYILKNLHPNLGSLGYFISIHKMNSKNLNVTKRLKLNLIEKKKIFFHYSIYIIK